MASNVSRTIGQGSDGTLVTTMATRCPGANEIAGLGIRPRPSTNKRYAGIKVTQASTALFTLNQKLSSLCSGRNHHDHKMTSATAQPPRKSQWINLCWDVNAGINRLERALRVT